jgi:hypothetical protein
VLECFDLRMRKGIGRLDAAAACGAEGGCWALPPGVGAWGGVCAAASAVHRIWLGQTHQLEGC